MMPLIVVNASTLMNVDAIAYAELEKGFSGESKLRVMFTCGTEQRFTGARAEVLLAHLRANAAEPASGEDDGP